MQSSARRGIQFPSADRSDKPDIPAHFANLVAALEKDASIVQGVFSARPSNPGYPLYFYWSTDTHLLSIWDGSQWFNVGTQDVIPTSLVDAKGDLIAGLSDNVVGRLPIGSNTYTLQADNTQANGMKWAMNEVRDLIAAKGDILAGTAADALTRVAVGADGTTLIADSAQAAGVRFGSPTLDYLETFLTGADITVSTTLPNFTDIVSVTLAAGKWRVGCRAQSIQSGGGNQCVVKVYDPGSNVIYIQGQTGDTGSSPVLQVTLDRVITLASTTTLTMAAGRANGGNTLKIGYQTPDNAGAAGKTTYINALRVG